MKGHYIYRRGKMKGEEAIKNGPRMTWSVRLQTDPNLLGVTVKTVLGPSDHPGIEIKGIDMLGCEEI